MADSQDVIFSIQIIIAVISQFILI